MIAARTVLGRTGLDVERIGMASSYGAPAAAVERAFEHGVNYIYYGSIRRSGFAQAIRNLSAERGKQVLVVESYSRLASLIGPSLELALRKLKSDYCDVLLLGLWNTQPYERILDAARKLRDRELVRHIAVSTHNRPFIPELARHPDFAVLHVRYNAVHSGTEGEVFPHLPRMGARPGVVSFTATSWGQLLKPGKLPTGENQPSATDCYRFALSRPAVDVCLSGPADEEQASAALKELDLCPLGAEELAWMLRIGKGISGK